MCDCFTMAYHETSNALQLHIKVNSENLMPPSKKLNTSSLRIPADPSWPKIPPRKLTKDACEIVDQSSVSKRTSRNGALIQIPPLQPVKSPRDCKHSSSHRTISSCNHVLKKVPGDADPRFKKITNVNSHAALDNSLEKDRDPLGEVIRRETVDHLHPQVVEKTTAERDINTQQVTTQKTEKLNETGNIRDVDVQIDPLMERDREAGTSWIERNTNTNYKRDTFNISQESNFKREHYVNDAKLKNSDDRSYKNERMEMKDTSNKSNAYQHSLNLTPTTMNGKTETISASVKEAGPPLLLMLDKNARSYPGQVDTIPATGDYLNQCYTVQVPVLTYQNIPVQISADRRMGIEQSVNDTRQSDTRDTNTGMAMNDSLSQPFTNPIHCQRDFKNRTAGTKTEVPNEENISARQKTKVQAESSPADKRMKDGHDFNKNSNTNDPGQVPERPSIKNPDDKQESSDSEYYVSSAIKKKGRNLRYFKIQEKICDTTGGEETTDTEFALPINSENRVRRSGVKKTGKNAGNPVCLSKSCDRLDSSRGICGNDTEARLEKCKQHESRSRHRSEQRLAFARREFAGRFLRGSEPSIAFRQRGTRGKLSRKARNYFQRNSRCGTLNVDCIARSINGRRAKCKHGRRETEDYKGKGATWEHCSLNNLTEDANFTWGKDNRGKIEFYKEEFNDIAGNQTGETANCEEETSARTKTEVTIEKSTVIPLETQQLLNKSYWDYYNKLRHKLVDADETRRNCFYRLATNTSDTENRRVKEVCETDKSKLSPELRTLEQCSALSSMINKALDSTLLSDTVQTEQIIGNLKSVSDPTTNTRTTEHKEIELNTRTSDDPTGLTTFNNRARRRKDKHADKRFLELKTIVFFGSMMYILIIFLPMLYDYVYYEEYSDYENLSYAELALEYVFSSFKEAFGSFFGGLNKILFQPRGCKKCKGYA